jgi:toxin ParE1/3/4
MRVVFRAEAALEVERAVLFYAQRQADLGVAFEQELDTVIDRIARAPETFKQVFAGVRRLHLKRFPYGVFYRIGLDQIEVIACFHSSRDPVAWQQRAANFRGDIP